MLTVSGTGCNGSSNGVNVYLRGPGSSNPQSDPPAAMSAGQAPEAGPWSLYLHAPLNPGTYTAGASCFDTATGRVLVTYPSKSFTVVAG
jgi:hypothetical protein